VQTPSPVQAGRRLAARPARTWRPDLAHTNRPDLHHHHSHRIRALSLLCGLSWGPGSGRGAVRAATAMGSRRMVAALAFVKGRLASAPAARTRLCAMDAID